MFTFLQAYSSSYGTTYPVMILIALIVILVQLFFI